MPLTFAQAVQDSDIPEILGYCVDDLPRIAKAVNGAQERLIFAGGETGWWGGWQRARFPITPVEGHIVLPRQFNRIINMELCGHGMPINNEFFELLPHVGHWQAPDLHRADWCSRDIQGYERGTSPTMVTLTATNQLLRVYAVDPRDYGKRMLISGLDQNSLPFYDASPSLGFYLTFAAPFVTTSFIVTKIETVQKDYTFGDIILQQVDATTGVAVNLARYGPNEINPSYRRYVVKHIPGICCRTGSVPPNLSVKALCKLQYIPVVQLTDWLVIQNLPALEEEVQEVRYSRMDAAAGMSLAGAHHKAAIRHLQNQLRHEMGEQHPAVNVDSFPGGTLEQQGIGTLI